MLGLKNFQINANKLIARENKKHIIRKLEQYYKVVNFREEISAKEYAVFAFWLAKKQGRLDNLNRIVKNVN